MKVILDIRSKNEYCNGHIPGAILIETNDVPKTRAEINRLSIKLEQVVKHFPNQTQYYVYCKKGFRAGVAKKILQSFGRSVTSLGGVQTEPLMSHMYRNGNIEYC